MAEMETVQKLNGDVLKEIDSLAQEYIGLHKIVDSPDTSQRMNLVNRREDAVGKEREGLEGIVSSEMANRIYADKKTADAIAYGIVAKGLKAEGQNLPEDPKKKEEAVHKYLREAGVDYLQLIKQIMNTRRPTKINELPDDHPLKILVNYTTNQSQPEARRLLFIQQRLVSLGDVHAAAIAEAFNKYSGTRLDPRVAKPQEALQVYAQHVQAARAKYEANAPERVYNVQPAKKAA